MLRVSAARVGADLLVDAPLDAPQLLGRDRLEVREVEAQAVGRDQRTLLLHVRAEHLAQRGVQQVRGGVVAADVLAAGVVDLRADQRRPTCSVPPASVPICENAVPRLWVSATAKRAAPATSSPVSPTWPPDSA